MPFPSSGHLPDPGFEPGPPALQADSLPSEPPAKLLGMLEGGYSAPITLAQSVQEWQDWVSFFEPNSIILQRKPKPRKRSSFLRGHLVSVDQEVTRQSGVVRASPLELDLGGDAGFRLASLAPSLRPLPS